MRVRNRRDNCRFDCNIFRPKLRRIVLPGEEVGAGGAAEVRRVGEEAGDRLAGEGVAEAGEGWRSQRQLNMCPGQLRLLPDRHG